MPILKCDGCGYTFEDEDSIYCEACRADLTSKIASLEDKIAELEGQIRSMEDGSISQRN